MDNAHLEFLIEPFTIDRPGRHVTVAVETATHAGLEPDMGPFATTASGPLDDVIEVIRDLLRASFDEGASSIQIRIDRGEQPPPAGLHDALERMVVDVEREAGAALAEMTRSQKQRAIARLDEQGAFLLRGAAEALAAMMQVSKVTLYAYLNAVADGEH